MAKQIKEQEAELNQLRAIQRSELNNANVFKELNNELSMVRAQLIESEGIREELQDKILLSADLEKNFQTK